MVTLLHRQRHGYDVRIYLREHGPAHVHVVKGEKRVKVFLHPIAFTDNKGFAERELRQIEKFLAVRLGFLLRKWEELHPDKL